eukprot:CAMPEP_0206422866 /NCGR_PEP_ID=MMETSP0324_2-20121206/2344_1 /ASSEMBLY_ACC=CAM_ASM_000836 /TAXON_ID=2866 /ORGANISM="Crypthecodinium cohnii, Strain Seligo" /LENGTH=77 /DNA_ID=CAMNT_0053887325 /DNA_START=758 /DNA_END=991 /DNA_ORIENTATION=-
MEGANPLTRRVSQCEAGSGTCLLFSNDPVDFSGRVADFNDTFACVEWLRVDPSQRGLIEHLKQDSAMKACLLSFTTT